MLKALLVEFNLKQKDLVPIFKSESIVSEVLKETPANSQTYTRVSRFLQCISSGLFSEIELKYKVVIIIEKVATLFLIIVYVIAFSL